MRTYDLPPVPNEHEREELTDLARMIRNGEPMAAGDRWRAGELIDLFVSDAEQWGAYLRDLTDHEDGSTSLGFVAVVFPLLAAVAYFVAQAAGTYAGVAA